MSLNAFIRFARPHTIAGTILSVSSLYLIAVSFGRDQSDYFAAGFIATLISCLAANIYIVGLNQLTDIEIDKINKPWLPLASGEYSTTTGYAIISIAVVISFAIAFYIGNYLLLTVGLSIILGTAYSLPPFRLKRYYFWAAFCIIAVRGVIVNIFLFLHFHYSISESQNIPQIIWMLTATIFVYSIVIAWFKDIPDMEGDKKYRISTLSLNLGAKTVFIAGNILLFATLIINVAAVKMLQLPVERLLFYSIHILMMGILLIFIFRTNPSEKKLMRKFYLLIWICFFLEYLTYGLSCFLYG